MMKRSMLIALICLPLALVGAACATLGGGGKTPEAVSANVNWPGHGGQADEAGYSSLDQINTGNIDRLGLAWSLDLDGEQTLEATPLAIDGVLYFTGTYSDIYAVDALSGKLLWKHAAEVWKHNPRKMRFIFPLNRGCAHDNGRIFSATTDGRLLALDARTGALIWSADTVKPDDRHTITGAPRTFNGKVIIGNGGGDSGSRGYVTAYDQQTGKQVWRFYTVPGTPEENKGDAAMEKAAGTWRGEYWKTGTGGTAWDGLTFDAELNRIYIGAGNSGPYDPEKRSPGGGDNLYLSSIIAVDADTGKYIWHYQVNPREAWDYKATANMIAATLPIGGKPRKVLMQAPTNGFFYVIDRKSGKLLSAEKIGKVTWADKIDLATGRPVERPNIRYQNGPVDIYPSTLGAHNWQSMAFNPKTGLVYIPYMQLGMKFIKAPDSFPGVRQELLIQDPEDGKGALLAWDPVSQKPRWKIQHDWIWNGGALTTAGNLVFQGAADGYVSAYDATSGKRLIHFNAGVGIIAPPISYSAAGKQYVSILAGWGGPNVYGHGIMNVGWKYNAQPRRLLTFALDGKAVLAPTAPPSNAIDPVDDPKFKINPKDLAAGAKLFGMNCTGCHGKDLVSSGSPGPDLRESAIALDRKTLYAALHEGAFMQKGMPLFDNFTEEQVGQIQSYIRAKAREALAASKPSKQ